MPALCSKLAYYASIMLDALTCLLCLKLCRHNRRRPSDKPGYYRNSINYWTFCDMNAIGSELFSRGLMSFGSGSGVAGVWRRIANFNISAGDDCPSPWVETTYNGGNYCIPANTNGGCYSVFYSTNGMSYQQVSGRGSVYAKDTLDGFWASTYTNAGIDSRDEPILLFFSPIILSGNSFIFNLFFLIFCLKFMCFAQW